jgi:hypothetical protein
VLRTPDDRRSDRRRPLDRAELVALAAPFALVAALAGAPLGIGAAVSPEALASGAVRLTGGCPYRARTGRSCPTCGLTRAFVAASHGRFTAASGFHPAALPIFFGTWVVFLATSGAAAALALRALGSRHPARPGPASGG